MDGPGFFQYVLTWRGKAMRVDSELLEERNGKCSFVFDYAPEYSDIENFRNWFNRPGGPYWTIGSVLSMEGYTFTLVEGSRVRIGGGPSIKSIYAELSRLYPVTPC